MHCLIATIIFFTFSTMHTCHETLMGHPNRWMTGLTELNLPTHNHSIQISHTETTDNKVEDNAPSWEEINKINETPPPIATTFIPDDSLNGCTQSHQDIRKERTTKSSYYYAYALYHMITTVHTELWSHCRSTWISPLMTVQETSVNKVPEDH